MGPTRVIRTGTRKIIARATGLLVAGAIINVAMAWGCATWGKLTFSQENVTAEEFSLIEDANETPGSHALALTGFGFQQRTILLTDPLGTQRLMERAMRDGGGSFPNMAGPLAQLDHRVSGWPMLCLRTEIWCHSETHVSADQSHSSSTDRKICCGFIVGSRPMAGPLELAVVLPLQPLWPQVAINTLFYAGIIWLLLFAPSQLRRWRRVRRGLCPACAYDLRASSSDVCPECGKMAHQSTAVHECGRPVIHKFEDNK